MLLLQHYIPESPKWTLNNSQLAASSSATHRKSGDEVVNPVAVDVDAEDAAGAQQQQQQAHNEVVALVKATMLPLRAPGYDVDKELGEIMQAAKQEAIDAQGAKEVTWTEVFSYRKSMIIGMGLMLFQVKHRPTCTLHSECAHKDLFLIGISKPQ